MRGKGRVYIIHSKKSITKKDKKKVRTLFPLEVVGCWEGGEKCRSLSSYRATLRYDIMFSC